MEVMEDGNLMDKVNILIQRDMEYYKTKQAVLQETICPGIIGGRLDFPRSASFAAVKLVIWWEEEFVAAFRKPSGFFQKNVEGSRDSIETSGGCGGIVRASDPTKFIAALSKSADQLLEHLHVLTQEALDHADLTVLTGTIGASALLKNSLWFYSQMLNEMKTPSITPLQTGYKKYHEMCEALAERLLDLHCRLLSLYILQDADCLDWDNNKSFFESERGSYIIQMWWLYMQGTKEDLWNTVPPKMAQRVFSGMLNESLTILTVRYTQSAPSEARSNLLLVDVSNLLLCVAQLLPSICETADELVHGSYRTSSKMLRDIHVKCQELYSCFLLRGAELDVLCKVFGKEDALPLQHIKSGPTPWIVFALPHIFQNGCNELALELIVLLAQPQPNWAHLLKILCSKDLHVLQLLINEFLGKSTAMKRSKPKTVDCGNLLCAADGTCKNVDTTVTYLSQKHYYDLLMSATEVLLYVGNDEDIKGSLVDVIVRQPDWAECLERRHVWNQIRPPWYEAVTNLAYPILPIVSETVINAVKTGATMYQAMSLVVACFSQFWDVIEHSLARVSKLFQEMIPCDIKPVNDSVLMQVLVSALYTHLIDNPELTCVKREVTFDDDGDQDASQPTSSRKSKDSAVSVTSAALAIAESLCGIDEDDKHTDQIEEFLSQVEDIANELDFFTKTGSKRVGQNQQVGEILCSTLLMSTQGKKSLKTLYHFIKNNSEWLLWKLEVSGQSDPGVPNRVVCPMEPLLHKMFHIGHQTFDQLLTKQMRPNWKLLLQNPMGLTVEKVWMQVSRRWEFQNANSSALSMHEMDIINGLTLHLKQ